MEDAVFSGPSRPANDDFGQQQVYSAIDGHNANSGSFYAPAEEGYADGEASHEAAAGGYVVNGDEGHQDSYRGQQENSVEDNYSNSKVNLGVGGSQSAEQYDSYAVQKQGPSDSYGPPKYSGAGEEYDSAGDDNKYHYTVRYAMTITILGNSRN